MATRRSSARQRLSLVFPVAAWLAAALVPGLAEAAPAVTVIAAPDTPVTLDQVKLLNTEAAPMVLLYAATNRGDAPLEQFTVTVFVFNAERQLKARQVAPGRRSLDGRETKFSAMVLDVGAIDPTDFLLVGVDQAQRVGSDDWWKTDLRTLAETSVKK